MELLYTVCHVVRKCPRYQYPISRGSNEDSLQGRESERGGKTAGNPRDDNSSSRFSSPYLSLSAIDANGRSDSPVHIRFPPFFPPSQPGARTRREVNWILAPFFPLPSLAARSLLLPSYSPTALCHCRFCACWENASHKYHLARRPPANVASNQRRLELHTRAPLAAIDFPPRHPLRRKATAAERVSSRAFIRHTPRTRRRNAQSIYLTELGATPSLIMCWRGCQSVGRWGVINPYPSLS